MTESPETPPPPKSPWQKMPLARLRWVLLLAVLATTAAFGGLQSADHVTPVAFGQSFSDGPLLITPHSLKVASSVPGLPALTPECRYLVLDVTVKNTSDSEVTLQTPGVVVGKAADCQGIKSGFSNSPIVIEGISNAFAAAVRVRNNVPVPLATPGFTEDFRMAWVVPQQELADNRQISIRMPTMTRTYSTFRIDQDWVHDADHYGEVAVPDPAGAR